MDDPTVFSLSRAADARLPVFMPWSKEDRPLTSTLDTTTLATEDYPWKPQNPFRSNSGLAARFVCEISGGTSGCTDGRSNSNSTTSEHLSGSLVVKVGNALVSGSVSGSYDQSMQELSNASRASRNSSYRCGRLILADEPRLSLDAKALLMSSRGVEEFARRYGDYYVSGYVLGADAGGCLSAASSSSRTFEKTTVTVKVEVLWEEFTTSETTTSVHATSSMDLAYTGYDTLDGESLATQVSAGTSTASIKAAATRFMSKSNELQVRVQKRLGEVGITRGASLPLTQCTAVLKAGLVAELILMPMSTLRDYVQSSALGERKEAALRQVEADTARLLM